MQGIPNPTTFKRSTATILAAVMVLSVLTPIGIVSAQTVSISQTAQGDTTVAPGETITIDATIDYSDVNSPAIDATLPSGWSVTSHQDDGGTYGPPEPAWIWLEGDEDGVSGGHTVTYTVQVPSDASAGEYTISAEGSGIDPADSSSVEDTDDLTVTVEDQEPENQGPTADAGADQTVDEGDTVTLDASGSSDDDGSVASYAWTQTDGPSVSLSDASATQPTFTAPDVESEQTLTFEVEVTDDDGATATDSVTVTVQPTAQPAEPSVSMTQSATTSTTVSPGDTITIDATIDYSDVNSPAIDATLPSGWTVTDHTDDGGQYGPPEPAWVWQEGDQDGVSGTHTVTYTVQVPSDASAGEYTISAEGSAIDPSDESSVSETDDLTITVEQPQQNEPPSIEAISDQTVTEGDSATVPVNADDPDGDTVSLSLGQAPDFVSLADGELTIAPQDGDAGTYTVEVTADDGNGGTDTETFQLTVEESTPDVTSAEVAITADSGVEASTFNGGSYEVTNTGNTNVETLTLDLSETMLPDMVFDPFNTAGDDVGKEFTLDGGDVTVQNVEYTNFHNGVDNSAGYDTLVVSLSGFEPGETMSFSVDNDPTSISTTDLGSQAAGPVSGLEITGATVSVDSGSGPVEATVVGDGSAGGAEATVMADQDESPPAIGVQGVSLDGSVLDDRHSAATVASADQTVTISGTPANAEVTLLRVEGELNLNNVPTGYDIEDYEANKAVEVQYDTVTTDSNGEATVDVTLTDADDVEESGLNYFTAWVEEPDGDTGPISDYVVLELDPDAANTPPTIDAIDDQTVTEGDSATVQVDASDTDGDPVSLSLGQAPDFVSLADDELTIAPQDGDAGTHTVEVTADDGTAQTTESFQLTVEEPPNQPPSAAFTASPADPEVDETVTFDAGDSSDDGSIASYEWTIETASGAGETTLLDTDFEEGSLSAAGWSHDAIEESASAGVNDATANSGSQSGFHNGGEGAIVSPSLDAGDAGSVTIQYWVQKGSEAFSENPDAGAGEDLVVEYLDSDGDWVEIDRIEDSEDPGAEFTESVTLDDADALHDGFQLRFRQQGASISSGDYWHVDDVSVVAETEGSAGTVTETGETTTHSFGAPGEYEVTLTVTDDDGATDQTTQTITVTEATDQPASVTEAVASMNDAGDDSLIGTQELQSAIDLWVEDDPVPETDGETISTPQLQEMIDLWVEDDPIGGDS